VPLETQFEFALHVEPRGAAAAQRSPAPVEPSDAVAEFTRTVCTKLPGALLNGLGSRPQRMCSHVTVHVLPRK
jgi:hypothetical protein